MSKQLYEEALADVKKLKEVAEDNAKRALLEAVTPRIRDLIENQLLGEMEVGDPDKEKLLFDETTEDGLDLDSSLVGPPEDMTLSGMPASSPAGHEQVLDLGAIAPPVVKVSMNPVQVNPEVDSSCSPVTDEDALSVVQDDDAYELSTESVKALNKLSSGSDLVFESNIKKLNQKINLVLKSSKDLKESADLSGQIQSIISEVQDMYVYLQTKLQSSSKKKSYETVLENYYSTLRKLTEQKMTKKNRNLSEDLKLSLNIPLEDEDQEAALQSALDAAELVIGEEEGEEAPEAETPADEEELDLDSDEEESDEDLEEEGLDPMAVEGHHLSDNLVVEIDEGMLRREIARMKSLREEKETKAQSWGHGAGAVADGFEDEDMGDPILDVEITTEGLDDLDEDDSKLDEVDDMVQAYMAQQQAQSKPAADHAAPEAPKDGEEEDGEGDLAESDLDQAYGGMDQEVNRSDSSPAAQKRAEDYAQKKAGQKDYVESLNRETRIQAEARKKATMAKKLQVEAAKKGNTKKALQFASAYKFFATKFNESVTRTNKIKGMIAETAHKGRTNNGGSTQSAAEANNLRAKLAETNLFNAKLLFTNKLLQNESLTKRQKAEVIERLDEAKTEREVKLVYESVTKSLQGSTARRMAESTDRGVIGSASRPARPASTNLNEGFEADRWARLAGIIK